MPSNCGLRACCLVALFGMFTLESFANDPSLKTEGFDCFRAIENLIKSGRRLVGRSASSTSAFHIYVPPETLQPLVPEDLGLSPQVLKANRYQHWAYIPQAHYKIVRDLIRRDPTKVVAYMPRPGVKAIEPSFSEIQAPFFAIPQWVLDLLKLTGANEKAFATQLQITEKRLGFFAEKGIPLGVPLGKGEISLEALPISAKARGALKRALERGTKIEFSDQPQSDPFLQGRDVLLQALFPRDYDSTLGLSEPVNFSPVDVYRTHAGTTLYINVYMPSSSYDNDTYFHLLEQRLPHFTFVSAMEDAGFRLENLLDEVVKAFPKPALLEELVFLKNLYDLWPEPHKSRAFFGKAIKDAIPHFFVSLLQGALKNLKNSGEFEEICTRALSQMGVKSVNSEKKVILRRLYDIFVTIAQQEADPSMATRAYVTAILDIIGIENFSELAYPTSLAFRAINLAAHFKSAFPIEALQIADDTHEVRPLMADMQDLGDRLLSHFEGLYERPHILQNEIEGFHDAP